MGGQIGGHPYFSEPDDEQDPTGPRQRAGKLHRVALERGTELCECIDGVMELVSDDADLSMPGKDPARPRTVSK